MRANVTQKVACDVAANEQIKAIYIYQKNFTVGLLERTNQSSISRMMA